MLMILSVIAFFIAYLSFQDGQMIRFYLSLFAGILFIGFMANNIIQVNKAKKKTPKPPENIKDE